MKRQPNRLTADARHFAGGALDRSQPLTFKLDGHRYEAFAGDTVFSALLAAGVDSVGTYHGEPIALDDRFVPPILDATSKGRGRSMPMDRVPVVQGLNLVTPASRPGAAGVSRLLGGLGVAPRSLAHKLDDPRLIDGAWLAAEPSETASTDTIVVGGGVAGMSAALAAAEGGKRVVLVERRGDLGGDARFFGTVGEGEAPEATIARLKQEIESLQTITVMPWSDAFALSGTRLRVHQVTAITGRVAPRVIALEAPQIVLATGAAERLPVFPGNRAPGVAGAVATFNRAERFGVWPGKRAVLATPHNLAYRLALLATDAGIQVQRVTDSRPAPQSRFIDFCKASGITIATGLVVRGAEPGRDPAALKVAFAVAIEGAESDTASLITSQLVAAGDFQPRLALWLMAGGQCDYRIANRRIEARGTLPGVALAGTVAGVNSTLACLKSGEAAVAILGGKSAPLVTDVAIDEIYESHAAATPIAPQRLARGAAFLDNGFSFATRPPRREAEAAPAAPAALNSLSISDVAAAVEVGLIPASDAGVVAAERCLGGGEIIDSGWRITPRPRPAGPPPYLHGRFGPKPQRAVIAAEDARSFEPGSLVYASSDLADPFAASGVVIGPAPSGNGATAVLARSALAGALFVRDTLSAVPAKLIEKLPG